MNVYLNDETLLVDNDCVLSELLHQQGYQAGAYAVALNRQFVARACYEETVLQPHDRIDIVYPMQGG